MFSSSKFRFWSHSHLTFYASQRPLLLHALIIIVKDHGENLESQNEHMKSEHIEKLTPKLTKMSLVFEAETSCSLTPYYSMSLNALRVIVIVMCTASPRATQHMRQHGKFDNFEMPGRLRDQFFDEFSSHLKFSILVIFSALGSSKFIENDSLELWGASRLLLNRFYKP